MIMHEEIACGMVVAQPLKQTWINPCMDVFNVLRKYKVLVKNQQSIVMEDHIPSHWPLSLNTASYQTTCVFFNWKNPWLILQVEHSIKLGQLRSNMCLSRVYKQRNNNQFTMFKIRASCRIPHQECLLWHPYQWCYGVKNVECCNVFIKKHCSKEGLFLIQEIANLLCRYESGEVNYIVCIQTCKLYHPKILQILQVEQSL